MDEGLQEALFGDGGALSFDSHVGMPESQASPASFLAALPAHTRKGKGKGKAAKGKGKDASEPPSDGTQL
eukprot:13431315-Alexandrium_andersonii.AAC.1